MPKKIQSPHQKRANKLLKHYRERLKLIGIPIDDNIKAEVLIYNAVSTLGFCQSENQNGTKTFEIQINEVLFECKDSTDLINTLVHELIHTVPRCMNHKKEWKHWAHIVNAKMNLNIKRSGGNKEESAHLINEEKKNKAKYKVTCLKCKKEIYYMRYCSIVRIPECWRCHCGSPFKSETLR